MAYASVESYEEMISALTNFQAQVDGKCSEMEMCANDCVTNTRNDPAAIKACDELKGNIAKIRGTFDTIQNIIKALKEELEEIQKAQSAMD